MKDKWLDSIKERMDSYEESAPEGLWSDIEASVFPKEKARRPAFVPWLWLSAAAAAIAAIFILTRNVSDDPKEEPVVAQTDITPSSSVNPGDGPAPSGDPGSLLASADVPEVRPSARRRTAAPPVKMEKTGSEPDAELPDAGKEDVEAELSEPAAPDDVVPDTPVAEEQDQRIATSHDGEDWSGYMSVTSEGEAGLLSKVSVKGSFTGAATESQDISRYDPTMFYYGSGDTRSSEHPDDATRATAPLPPLATASSVNTESQHHRPVRLSLTAHMPLGRVFGIETGASYTLLRSTFTTTSGSTVSRDLQTLKYIGIPVNLTARLYGNDWCSVYLSGGTMAEKCISGEVVNTKYVAGQPSGGKDVRSLEIKPLLWSLNAAAGAQVNLGRSIGLYAEPGVSYHFDDGSSVQTVYKDRPLDFMLTLGARVSFR